MRIERFMVRPIREMSGVKVSSACEDCKAVAHARRLPAAGRADGHPETMKRAAVPVVGPGLAPAEADPAGRGRPYIGLRGHFQGSSLGSEYGRKHTGYKATALNSCPLLPSTVFRLLPLDS
jgi:hypothetical protein